MEATEKVAHYIAAENHLEGCEVCQQLARDFVDREDVAPLLHISPKRPPEGAFITIEPTPMGALTRLEQEAA